MTLQVCLPFSIFSEDFFIVAYTYHIIHERCRKWTRKTRKQRGNIPNSEIWMLSGEFSIQSESILMILWMLTVCERVKSSQINSTKFEYKILYIKVSYACNEMCQGRFHGNPSLNLFEPLFSSSTTLYLSNPKPSLVNWTFLWIHNCSYQILAETHKSNVSLWMKFERTMIDIDPFRFKYSCWLFCFSSSRFMLSSKWNNRLVQAKLQIINPWIIVACFEL